MRLILSTFFTLFLLSALGVAALVFTGIERQPGVATGFELSHRDIARAKRILSENDPRRLARGDRRTASLTEADLDLAANFLLQQVSHGAVDTDIGQGRLSVRISLELPDNPIGPYLNLGFSLEQHKEGLHLRELRIGQLLVPDALAEPLYRIALDRLFADEDISLIRDSIQSVALTKNRAQVTYEWNPTLLERARNRLVPPEASQRLRRYQARLALISRQKGAPSRTSMSGYLAQMFRFAGEQSAVNGDPIAENRAAILVLAAYVAGKDLGRFLDEQDGFLARPLRRPLYLRGRVDLAQHFMVSAALAAETDGALAHAVGLFKEIADSRGGSGFSFSDLAADLAGSHFGSRATASIKSAKRIQATLAKGINDADIMPPVQDLPAPMTKNEFEHRFGDPSDPRYASVKDNILARLSTLSLYQRP